MGGSVLRAIVGHGLLALAAAAPLTAQEPRWEVDLSGSRIRYDTLSALTAPAISGLLEWRRPALFGRVGAGVTGFQGAGWTFHGSADVSHRISPLGPASPVHFEVAAGGAASRHSSGSDSRIARADVRAHAGTGAFGGWIGAGLAFARSSFDSATVRGVVPNVGVWTRRGSLQAMLGYRRPALLQQTFHEAHGTLGYSGEAFDVLAFAGVRGAMPGLPREHDVWGGLTATLWLTPSAALMISGGRHASDVLQGLPGGDHLTIGLRLARNRARIIPEPALRTPLIYDASTAETGGIAFEVEGVRTVEIAGDWNAWSAEPLERDPEGRWILPSGLPPGIHRFNLRVDGERWIVPEGFPSTDDGFGGTVGLLIISEGP